MKQRAADFLGRQFGKSLRSGKPSIFWAFVMNVLLGSADGMPRFQLTKVLIQDRRS